MRTIIPQPGYTEQDFRDLLATKQFVYADLFTLYMKTGDTLRFTTAQNDTVVFPMDVDSPTLKVAYNARGLKIMGLSTKIGTGVEVDEQEASVTYTEKMRYQGLAYMDAFRLGRFDGTMIRRDRVYAADWGEPWIGGVQRFTGKVAGVDNIDRGSAGIKVKSDLILLDIQMPRNLFQPSCVHTVFDPGCTLNRDDFERTGTLEAGSSTSRLVWSGDKSGLALGRIDIEDGSGVTQIRTIRKVDGSAIYLAYPLDFEPNTGMLFRAYPGCNRSKERCAEFGNTAHLKAFPFVPVAETAM